MSALTISGGIVLNGDTATVPNDSTSRIYTTQTGLFTKTQGWIAVRFHPSFASTTASGSDQNIFVWMDADLTGVQSFNNIVYCAWRQTSASWDCRRENVSPALQLLVGDVFASGDSRTLVFAWDSTTIKLSVNGAAFSSQGNTKTSQGGTGSQDPRIAMATNHPIEGDLSCPGAYYWYAMGSGTLTDTDAATINGFGDPDPYLAEFPGTPTFLWKADDVSFLTPADLAPRLPSATPLVYLRKNR